MSLLSEAMTPCVRKERTSTPDGYGAAKTEWTDGAPFDAAIVLDTSMEARRAAQAGVSNLYTIGTSRAVTLMFGDVFVRSADEKIFRVTSDGTDKKTPASAALDLRIVTAEELPELPDDKDAEDDST